MNHCFIMMESMGMDENITNKKQKKAIVIIKGGFGNQIFQFAFANYLKSLNFKVSINIDFFNIPNVVSIINLFLNRILSIRGMR